MTAKVIIDYFAGSRIEQKVDSPETIKQLEMCVSAKCTKNSDVHLICLGNMISAYHKQSPDKVVSSKLSLL